jgi:hypothetical protein
MELYITMEKEKNLVTIALLSNVYFMMSVIS